MLRPAREGGPHPALKIFSAAMGAAFEPRDPDYEKRVRASFARQGLLATFAAELRSVEPGAVEIEVPFSPGLTQQDDFFHDGVGTAILDSACGYAARRTLALGVAASGTGAPGPRTPTRRSTQKSRPPRSAGTGSHLR